MVRLVARRGNCEFKKATVAAKELYAQRSKWARVRRFSRLSRRKGRQTRSKVYDTISKYCIVKNDLLVDGIQSEKFSDVTASPIVRNINGCRKLKN